MYKTPILFIIFNRPETTKRVFEAICQAQPKQLFIAADGPRLDKDGEKQLCESAREIVSHVDWDCEVKTLFREKNLGCKIGVSSAINWFFENVEQGIILEDDCLPNQSFFSFCEQMLEMYKDDNRIMHISGDNFQFGKQRGEGDYYFSKMNHIWGWATWKRAWKYYDLEMPSLEQFIKNNYIEDVFSNKKIAKDWINIFIKTQNNEINTWDAQWAYTMWSQNGLAILPNKNLVKNIGFGNDATHTKTSNILLEKNESESLVIKKHPSVVIRDYDADIFFHQVIRVSIIKRIYNKILSIILIKNFLVYYLKM
ncbi:MAG: nucleotide-diphospho-sugar transferase [Candidatus Nomurabacteria bacterium]|nr:nucleotide-diphospho-sugar transferase [Candidatus Nomurabacteria bacterium]